MPRRLRSSSGGYVYHVLNRALRRARIFEKPADYAAFETEAKLAALRRPLRRGLRYASDGWTKRTAKKLGLESSLRPRSRDAVHQVGSGDGE